MNQAGKIIFNDIYNLGYPFYLVHPYKQKAAEHLVKHAPAWVTHIIVFGSAVGDWHFYEKDIDVCLIGKSSGLCPTEESKMKMKDTKYDFLVYDSMDDLLASAEDISNVKYDILKNGVLLYEKS